MNENELLKSLIGGKCPTCNQDFVVGIGMPSPVANFILTPAQLEAKKKALVDAIIASGLLPEAKKSMLEQYSDPRVMVDPSIADFMINELRTKYAPEKPKPEAAPKKKSDGAKKAGS